MLRHVGWCLFFVTFVSAVLTTFFCLLDVFSYVWCPFWLPLSHPNAATSTTDVMLPCGSWVIDRHLPFCFFVVPATDWISLLELLGAGGRGLLTTCTTRSVAKPYPPFFVCVVAVSQRKPGLVLTEAIGGSGLLTTSSTRSGHQVHPSVLPFVPSCTRFFIFFFWCAFFFVFVYLFVFCVFFVDGHLHHERVPQAQRAATSELKGSEPDYTGNPTKKYIIPRGPSTTQENCPGN